jgi:uncharacterized protein (AIM24 family)
LRATRGPGEVLLAPTVPGDILIFDHDGVREYLVQKDGFLAGAEGVRIESRTTILMETKQTLPDSICYAARIFRRRA